MKKNVENEEEISDKMMRMREQQILFLQNNGEMHVSKVIVVRSSEFINIFSIHFHQ